MVESDRTAKVDISNEEVVNIQEGVLRLGLAEDEVLTREVLDSPSLIFFSLGPGGTNRSYKKTRAWEKEARRRGTSTRVSIEIYEHNGGS